MVTGLLWMQWPGFILGLLGAILVSAKTNRQRYWGFVIWVLSDFFFVGYGIGVNGWGLVALQLLFIITSARGALNNR